MFAPETIYRYYKNLLKKLSGEFKEGFDDVFKESFETIFGGDVHLVERFDDLGYISTFRPDSSGERFLNLLQTSDAFDACEWFGSYVYIMSATNDAGGQSYWVPKEIADKSNFLIESVEKTKNFWS